MERKNVWENYTPSQLEELEKLCKEYRDFLDNGKTERECIDVIVNEIEEAGYVELSKAVKAGKALKKGDKVYAVCRNKVIGRRYEHFRCSY